MDFFRSILSDDPQPESLANHYESDSDPHQFQSPIHPETEIDDSNSNLNSASSDGDGSDNAGAGGLWSFGDLVKTLTTKSESVFETYRRDLKEFGTGLKLESDLFCEVATRAVKEMPDVGTSAIDGVLKSTADIISQGKVALLLSSDIDDSDRNKSNDNNNLRKNSRFDSKLISIRNDSKTYCEDPEDLEDYMNWKLGFVVGDMKDEIEELVGDDNGSLAGIYRKLVPSKVDDGTFWFRYFYKVFKLKQQEDMRAKLVKRSLDVDDEEELSWDVDDDEEEEEEEDSDILKLSTSKDEKFHNVDDNVSIIEKAELVSKSEEKDDTKVDSSNVIVKSNKSLSQEEKDLEWDEIEDLGNNDEKKVSYGETSNKGELVKPLNGLEDEEEDLSWDIEEDDDADSESVKAGNK